MACEAETVTVTVKYFVDASIEGVSGVQRFGPVSNVAAAENLLAVLSARANVTKAELIREIPEA